MASRTSANSSKYTSRVMRYRLVKPGVRPCLCSLTRRVRSFVTPFFTAAAHNRAHWSSFPLFPSLKRKATPCHPERRRREGSAFPEVSTGGRKRQADPSLRAPAARCARDDNAPCVGIADRELGARGVAGLEDDVAQGVGGNSLVRRRTEQRNGQEEWSHRCFRDTSPSQRAQMSTR